MEEEVKPKQQQDQAKLRRPRAKGDKPIYKHLKKNTFVHRNHVVVSADEVEVCSCAYQDGEEESACGESCLNRMCFVECTPGYCPAGDNCHNQRFQKCQYAPLKVQRVGEKGFGLFAAEDIKAGDFVVEYCGEVLPNHEGRRRVEEYHRRGMMMYVLVLSGNEVVDATIKGSFGRFINHSCEPNCETRKWRVLGEIRVGIFARCDLPKGTELTYDYNFEWYGGTKVPCLCGTESCLGFLGAKSKAFLEEAHLWEEGDDRYIVDSVPMYDTDDLADSSGGEDEEGRLVTLTEDGMGTQAVKPRALRKQTAIRLVKPRTTSVVKIEQTTNRIERSNSKLKAEQTSNKIETTIVKLDHALPKSRPKETESDTKPFALGSTPNISLSSTALEAFNPRAIARANIAKRSKSSVQREARVIKWGEDLGSPRLRFSSTTKTSMTSTSVTQHKLQQSDSYATLLACSSHDAKPFISKPRPLPRPSTGPAEVQPSTSTPTEPTGPPSTPIEPSTSTPTEPCPSTSTSIEPSPTIIIEPRPSASRKQGQPSQAKATSDKDGGPLHPLVEYQVPKRRRSSIARSTSGLTPEQAGPSETGTEFLTEPQAGDQVMIRSVEDSLEQANLERADQEAGGQEGGELKDAIDQDQKLDRTSPQTAAKKGKVKRRRNRREASEVGGGQEADEERGKRRPRKRGRKKKVVQQKLGPTMELGWTTSVAEHFDDESVKEKILRAEEKAKRAFNSMQALRAELKPKVSMSLDDLGQVEAFPVSLRSAEAVSRWLQVECAVLETAFARSHSVLYHGSRQEVPCIIK